MKELDPESREIVALGVDGSIWVRVGPSRLKEFDGHGKDKFGCGNKAIRHQLVLREDGCLALGPALKLEDL